MIYTTSGDRNSEKMIFTTSSNINSTYSHPRNRVNFTLLKWGEPRIILKSKWLPKTTFSVASRIVIPSVHSKDSCMTCFDREDTVECPVGQNVRFFSIFTVCDSQLQTLVGTCNVLKGHVTLRSYRANPGSRRPVQRAHWGSQGLPEMSCSV